MQRKLLIWIVASVACFAAAGLVGVPAAADAPEPVWEWVDAPEGVLPGQVWTAEPGVVYVLADGPAPGPDSVVYRLDGDVWSESLRLPAGYGATGLFGTGPDDVYVAWNGPSTVIYHFDGATWTPEPVPPEAASWRVLQITGVPGEVQAAAVRYALRRTAGTWSVVYDGLAYGGPGFPGVEHMVLLGADEGYFVQCGGQGWWDGAAWSAARHALFCDTWDMWGTSDAAGSPHVYTVGNSNFSSALRIWKYDAAARLHRLAFVDSIRGSGLGVWGSGPDDVYVTGHTGARPPFDGVIYHHDGTAWSRLGGFGDLGTISDVWGTGPTDVWFAVPGDPGGGLLHLTADAPPVVDAGGPYQGTEGAPIALDAAQATDVDGDRLTLSWTAAPPEACSFSDATALQPDITCDDDGVYTVTLTADDGTAPPVGDAATLTVANVAPRIAAVTGPAAPVDVGAPAAVTVSFTDPGADTFDVTWTWGDGDVTRQSDLSGSPAATSHEYASPGLYPVAVLVEDDDGGSDTGRFEFVVAVDRDAAAFVTGGGYLGPSGDDTYPGDDDGKKARFGFNARYEDGAPTGHFNARLGDLHVQSAAIDWLVISGDGVATFQGTAVVERGGAPHPFRVTARDRDTGGESDALSIQIWRDGEDPFAAAPSYVLTGPLDGGKVQVHR